MKVSLLRVHLRLEVSLHVLVVAVALYHLLPQYLVQVTNLL